MGLSKRYKRVLDSETLTISLRQERNRKIAKQVFERSEGNSVTDRVISVLKKGLEAEKRDRKDKTYREDKEDFDFKDYIKDEPIDEDSSREERDEWFDSKYGWLMERMDEMEENIEERLTNRLNRGSNMTEDSKVKQNRKDRIEKFDNKDDEELVKLMDKYEEQGLSKVEAHRKARIEYFQEGN